MSIVRYLGALAKHGAIPAAGVILALYLMGRL